jgi:hypothetical protein
VNTSLRSTGDAFEKSHILDAAMACREGAGQNAPLKLKIYFERVPHLIGDLRAVRRTSLDALRW